MGNKAKRIRVDGDPAQNSKEIMAVIQKINPTFFRIPASHLTGFRSNTYFFCLKESRKTCAPSIYYHGDYGTVCRSSTLYTYELKTGIVR